MPKYHINKNGEPKLCKAKISCPLTEKHFDTLTDAQSYYENAMTENLNIPTTISADSYDYTAYNKESEDFYNSISKEDRDYLEGYVNHEFTEINTQLWAGKKIAEVDKVNKILSKRSEIRTLWRKPATNHEGLENVKEGDIIDLKGLTSTSLNPNAMLPLMITEADKYEIEVPYEEHEFEGLYKVKVPEEYKKNEPNVVFQFITDMGKPVSHLSHMPQEKEILLPSDTKWKVVGVKKERTFASSNNLIDGESQRTKERRAVVYQLVEVK